MSKKILYIMFIVLILLSGCSKKDSNSEPAPESNISETVHSEFEPITCVSGISFAVREADIQCDYVYNPSGLNQYQSPLGYLCSQTDNDGNPIEYQYAGINFSDYDAPILIKSPDYFGFFDPRFEYVAGECSELTYSLSYAVDKDSFSELINMIDLNAAKNFEIIEESFNKTEYGNTILCSGNITFTSVTGKQFSGIIVMAESKNGQYFYIAAGENGYFSKDELSGLADSFSLSLENSTNMEEDWFSDYDTESVSFDFGGRNLTGDFSKAFNFMTGNSYLYTQKYGFDCLYAVNEYLTFATMYGCFYMPKKNITPDEFLKCYSFSYYDPVYSTESHTFTDSDGRTWTEYAYDDSDIFMDYSNCYVCVDGRYVYLFILNYNEREDSDALVSLLESGISSLTLTDSGTAAYKVSTNSFKINYNNLINPDPPEQVEDTASGSDAVEISHDTPERPKVDENYDPVKDANSDQPDFYEENFLPDE